MGTTGTTAPSSWRVNVAGDSNGVSTVTPRFNGLTQTSGATNVGLNAGSLNGNDRWLGVYANATGDTRNIQVSFNNQTGVAITQINIEYDMKLWVNRNNSNRWGGFTMEYSTNGTTWTSMGSSLSGSITNQGLSANASPYWTDLGGEINNITGTYVLPAAVNNGSTFYLRWNGLTAPLPSGYSSNDRRHVGIAIDDFKLSINNNPLQAVPEPQTYFMILVGLIAVVYKVRSSKKV